MKKKDHTETRSIRSTRSDQAGDTTRIEPDITAEDRGQDQPQDQALRIKSNITAEDRGLNHNQACIQTRVQTRA